jgi:hypothetical protein
LTLHVDVPWPEYVDQRSDHVLNHSLKHLMKDVGGDRKEYVGEGEIFPEWMVYGFQPGVTTSLMKYLDFSISQKVRI